MPPHLYASENFVWSTSHVLGKGATGAVYKGVHKETGEAVAVKTFNQLSHMRPDYVQMREFEVLKKVNHENIVRLLAIEQEQNSENKVLVMELCTGGSLFNILDDPENAFGLEESEFLLVLKHVSDGMKHLRDNKIVHRDLKPGNIMKFITIDGRSIYKLTDFGAARELPDDQQFMSLYGTEEYLHPDMYERAVLKKPVAKGFRATVDLWSLGVTLYHVATGSLPFRPHGGRKNKETMHYITTEKESGVISGVQTSENGPIMWNTKLPESCQLSVGLQKLITPLLAGLLESDPTKIWSFDQFFDLVTSILLHKLVCVFFVNRGQLLHIYIQPEEKLNILQYSILEQTDVPFDKQIITYDNKCIKKTLFNKTIARNFPLTTKEQPLLLFSEEMSSVNITKKNPNFKFPSLSSNIAVENDAAASKMYCSTGYCIKRSVDSCTLAMKIFHAAAKTLNEIFLENMLEIEQKIKSLQGITHKDSQRTQVLSSCFRFCASVLDVVFPESSNILDTSSKKLRDGIIDKEENIQALTEKLNLIEGKKTSLVMKSEMRLKELSLWAMLPENFEEINRNCRTAVSYVQKIKESWQILSRNRTLRSLSYNDEQYHKLEKRKLHDTSSKFVRFHRDTCLQNYWNTAEKLSLMINCIEGFNTEIKTIREDIIAFEKMLSVHNTLLDNEKKEFDDRFNLVLYKINEEWVARKKDDHSEESIMKLREQKSKHVTEKLQALYVALTEAREEARLSKQLLAQFQEIIQIPAHMDEDTKAFSQ